MAEKAGIEKDPTMRKGQYSKPSKFLSFILYHNCFILMTLKRIYIELLHCLFHDDPYTVGDYSYLGFLARDFLRHLQGSIER